MNLKPCPFCDGTASLFYSQSYGFRRVNVACDDCKVRASGYSESEEAAAIEAWNRRASPSPSPAGEGWQEKAERLERREVHLEVEFAKALRDLPECPPQSVLRLLRYAGVFPDDWERGKRLQNKVSLNEIPPKTEYEQAAGVWTRIREAMLAAAPPPPGSEPSSALAEAMDLHEQVSRLVRMAEIINRKLVHVPLSTAKRIATFLAAHSKGE